MENRIDAVIERRFLGSVARAGEKAADRLMAIGGGRAEESARSSEKESLR